MPKLPFETVNAYMEACLPLLADAAAYSTATASVLVECGWTSAEYDAVISALTTYRQTA